MGLIGTLLQIGGMIVGGPWGVALYVAGIAETYNEQRLAKSRARDAYNNALKDRTQMLDMQGNLPRSMVLGRVRNVEGILRRWTTGTHSEKLTLIVALAGHEVDAFEQWYAGEVPLTLDGDGWVTSAPYGKQTTEPAQFTGSLNGSGQATVAAGGAPVPGTVIAQHSNGGGPESWNDLTANINGNNVELSGGGPNGMFSVALNLVKTTPKMRIRAFNGQANQDLYAVIGGDYPGKLRSTDKFRGIALAVVDLIYDTDVFPTGIPDISCVMRGAKVLDPRDAQSRWTANPMLLTYHFARHAYGMRMPAGEIRQTDIEDGADVCDVSTQFTLRKPDNSTVQVTLPRYQAGIVIPSTMAPRDALDELCESMAGRWGWAGGTLRIRAGAFAAPSFALDASWVAQLLDESGAPSDDPVVKFTNGLSRTAKVNRIVGRCFDPDLRYQLLPFPLVQDDDAIAADGEEYEATKDMLAVNHIAHAQHLARVFIREAQAPLRGEIRCNLHAFDVELFDTGTLTLPRFSMTAKEAECIGWSWHPGEGVRLQVAELTAAIFSVDELDGRDPAPNSALPSPWYVATPTGVQITSGTTLLTDGSVLTRTEVTWDAHPSGSVRAGGAIEVQYWVASQTLPANDGGWFTWEEAGSATQAIIPGLLSNQTYLFRVRAVQKLPLVRSDWAGLKAHRVAAPPQVSLNRDFTDGANGWNNVTAVVQSGGASGGTAARMEGDLALYSRKLQAIDPSRTYLLRVRLTRDSGSGGANFYCGVFGYDSNGNLLQNNQGATYPYAALEGPVPVDSQWHTYYGIVTGAQAWPTGSLDPHKFLSGTVNASPAIIASGTSGAPWFVDFLELLDLTPVFAGYNILDSTGALLGNADIKNAEIVIDANGRLLGIGSGAGSYIANNRDAGGVVHIARPIGGQYSSNANPEPGALRIRLPRGFTNAMVRFTLTIFEYDTGSVQTYEIGGYTYQPNETWYNVLATYTGDPSKARPVRFGKSGSVATVWVGPPEAAWFYPKALVTDVLVGYSDVGESSWREGWIVDFDTGAQSYTNAVPAPKPGGNLTLYNTVGTALLDANAATDVTDFFDATGITYSNIA